MSTVAPLGPPRIDPAVLPAADFEALCVRLARLEAPGVTATGAPGRGPVPVPGMDPVEINDPAGPELEPELSAFERSGHLRFP